MVNLKERRVVEGGRGNGTDGTTVERRFLMMELVLTTDEVQTMNTPIQKVLCFTLARYKLT